eukprot:665275-Pleurochrysis_carterae.AAC.1
MSITFRQVHVASRTTSALMLSAFSLDQSFRVKLSYTAAHISASVVILRLTESASSEVSGVQ